MKKFIILSLSVLVVLGLTSCKEEISEKEISENTLPEVTTSGIPQAVTDKFAQDYPQVTNVKWEQEGEYYEAEFDANGLESEVVYDANGNEMGSEIEVNPASLPSGIADYVAANYDGATIAEAASVSENGSVYYEVEFEQNGEEVELLFDGNGNFVQAEMDDDEGDHAEMDDDDQDELDD